MISRTTLDGGLVQGMESISGLREVLCCPSGSGSRLVFDCLNLEDRRVNLDACDMLLDDGTAVGID